MYIIPFDVGQKRSENELKTKSSSPFPFFTLTSKKYKTYFFVNRQTNCSRKTSILRKEIKGEKNNFIHIIQQLLCSIFILYMYFEQKEDYFIMSHTFAFSPQTSKVGK